MKYFSSRRILQAFHEATAYSVLKPLQGHVIPFCNGIYDAIGDEGVVVLLLEELCGTTLLETLTNLSADVGHERLQEELRSDDNFFLFNSRDKTRPSSQRDMWQSKANKGKGQLPTLGRSATTKEIRLPPQCAVRKTRGQESPIQ